MAIVEMGVAAASGGVFGVVGTLIGRVARFFERRQEQAHETARWAHETHLLELQMQADRAETEAELAIARTAGSWKGLEASMAAEAAIGASYRWVDAVRGLTRPVLTVMLWVIAALVFYASDGPEQARVVEAALFAATAATLWWFGDRSARTPPGI